MNSNDLLAGGIRPHNYCLPVLKRNIHQRNLQEAATSGENKFFLGTDSAPHGKLEKESSCGCAGCFSAPAALELYAQVFNNLNAIDKFEAFASVHGPHFYGLPVNTETITLIKESWTVPQEIILNNGKAIVPFYAGQKLDWKLQP